MISKTEFPSNPAHLHLKLYYPWVNEAKCCYAYNVRFDLFTITSRKANWKNATSPSPGSSRHQAPPPFRNRTIQSPPNRTRPGVVCTVVYFLPSHHLSLYQCTPLLSHRGSNSYHFGRSFSFLLPSLSLLCSLNSAAHGHNRNNSCGLRAGCCWLVGWFVVGAKKARGKTVWDWVSYHQTMVEWNTAGPAAKGQNGNENNERREAMFRRTRAAGHCSFRVSGHYFPPILVMPPHVKFSLSRWKDDLLSRSEHGWSGGHWQKT